MPLKPFRTLPQLAGTCLLAAAAVLSGCVSNPPVLPQGPQTLSLAVQRLADDLIEQTDPGSLCSILLVRDQKLRYGAAPSLPDGVVQAVDGVA